jgi:hypothetical protein
MALVLKPFTANSFVSGPGTKAYIVSATQIPTVVGFSSALGYDGTQVICQSFQPQVARPMLVAEGVIDLGRFTPPFSTIVIP